MRTLRFASIATLVSIIFVAASAHSQAQPKPQTPPKHQSFELNTVLMECTFEIEGQNPQGRHLLGTAFIMGRPIPGRPKSGRYVLITAAHVLEDMPTDTPTLDLRRNIGKNRWVPEPIKVTIRAKGKPLWTKPPDADVAVMYVNLPTNVKLPLLPTNMLASDATLARLEIHPGDELECLGYPLGFRSNNAGFPILRSGRIASFPLLPTSATKTFLLDIRVFKGNSGGPVYLDQSNRVYGNATHLGTVAFIAGLVSSETLANQVINGPYEQERREIRLNLATVVDASFIKQAIDMLPKP